MLALLALAGGAVQSAFEAFGFAGEFLIASTLTEAEQLLAAPQHRIDLIMPDEELPDGTGLDVVRAVRSPPGHGHVPILILAGREVAQVANRRLI